ncbi:hypothetical protein HOQ51_gp30 [uncultured phage_MedDCM-OCT-S35-C6]|uniref:Holin n=1 Tax=uncultured phage_MedDCM-OCT-S35-C6 TaxID=2741075 RepID=A0A6S4PAI8_9CAUD|nr:hypothetical protein HOQ51_gp30 [uncultured phage_MedDCM-OCT-S35-C6]BAQ94170.1 hypothetical protein [uncultured phage_MedDCM-OCT-S35-C6]|tara:strand:+ start:528 stop:857 length:330 start_codon:yes stop_codon:yes gene_type:complete
MIFGLLGKTLISHTTKALSAHLVKRENRQVAEIEESKVVRKAQIDNSGIKDELILAWFLIIMSLPLLGETERFLKWAEVLSAMPSEIFYIFGAIVAASFGIKVSNIFKK